MIDDDKESTVNHVSVSVAEAFLSEADSTTTVLETIHRSLEKIIAHIYWSLPPAISISSNKFCLLVRVLAPGTLGNMTAVIWCT